MLRYVHHALSSLFVGCLVLFSGIPAATAQAPKGADALKLAVTKAEVTDRDDDETRLLKERYNAALDEWESLAGLVHIGQITAADAELQACLRRVASAGMEFHRDGKDRLKLLEEYVRIAKSSEVATEGAFTDGRASSQEKNRARYLRLDAELALLREKKRTL
jgi:hypothetical protein